MANQLKMAIIESILALYQRGWSKRQIARELGLDRETVARHLRLAVASKPASAPSSRRRRLRVQNPPSRPSARARFQASQNPPSRPSARKLLMRALPSPAELAAPAIANHFDRPFWLGSTRV